MDTQAVTDPSHYDIQVAGISCEVYDIQRALLDRYELDRFSGHCLATAVKYIFRCGHKGGVSAAVSDLGKAIFYTALALAELNSGRLPIGLVERLRRMTPDFDFTSEAVKGKTDLFEPIKEDECKDGFCPIRTPAYRSSGEQGIHPAARLVENIRHSEMANIISPETERQILDRKW